MFQNIKESTIEGQRRVAGNEERKKFNLFSNVLSISYIPMYIVSFMISMVGVGGGFSPFSISVLVAALSNSIPILGVAVAGVLGNLISFGVQGALSYLLTALVFVASVFIIRPRYNEDDKNEKMKLAKNVFIATLLVQIAKVGMTGFTIYDALSAVCISMIAVVFYKIFVNSLVVTENFHEKKAFSIEEVLGASLLLAISVSCFGEFSVLGFSIRNILSIFIVLVLGWKNGVLVGTTAGVTIGVTLGVITSSDPVMVAAYAISGMLAGILNRFGRIGVIVGFCLGNVVLAYVSNGYTVELIHLKEILIASIGLLAVPKKLEINIEEFMGNSKFMPVFPSRALNKSKETAERLNNVSETIQQMANSYDLEEQPENIENNGLEKNKQIFFTELLDNLQGYEDNMLYDDISNVEGPIVQEIFTHLWDKQQITREDLLKIFADCNSYIVGFDDKKISEYLEENIKQMVRVINMSYKISKSSFVWMKKIEENKKNMKTQLDGVSKAISSLAQDIAQDGNQIKTFAKEHAEIIALLEQKNIKIQELSIQKKDRYSLEVYLNENTANVDFEVNSEQKSLREIKDTISKIATEVLKEKIEFYEEASLGNRLNFISADKYTMAYGTAEAIKNKSEISGDSILQMRLRDGKYLVALSDGMGSGQEAKQSSSNALKMLENLLLAGFQKETSLELINTALINQNENIFATLDIAIIDLYQGKIEWIKRGACPTYLKHNKKVQMIKSNTLPAGIIETKDLQAFDKDIENGEIMLMCSDGILDSNIEYKNKELWVRYLLEDIETNNTKKIADLVLNEAIDNNFGQPKDDMTVIVCKFLLLGTGTD